MELQCAASIQLGADLIGESMLKGSIYRLNQYLSRRLNFYKYIMNDSKDSFIVLDLTLTEHATITMDFHFLQVRILLLFYRQRSFQQSGEESVCSVTC